MRLAWVLALVAVSAHADLYRWVDPASGSVKFSSLPPADPGVEAGVVPYKAPPLPPKPAAVPKPVAVAPASPAATTSVAQLETQWRSLLTHLVALKPEDFSKGSDGARQQLQAYEAVRSELDRLDPAGAARRASEAVALAEHARQGAAAR